MRAWESNIRKVVPYVPGEQPKKSNIIKLNTNENPYPPSPLVEKMRENMDDLRLYPDPTAKELVTAIAEYHGLEESQLFVGVGSDDVLAMSFLTFFNSSKPILFPDITYSFYDVWAELFHISFEQPALDEHFMIQKEDYYKANGGVIFPNPNAPTGLAVSIDFIEDILKHNQDVVVIIDEAYVDFGAMTALPLIHKYDNLLVVRTFSKSRSMAGLRIGYAMGHPELIKALNDVKYSYNSYTMNRPSLLLGKQSIEDETYFQARLSDIIETRTWFCEELTRLGFVYPESKTNFVFAHHKTADAKDIFEAAKEAGIYVRYFNKPRIKDYLRITIGTNEEMKKLVAFLEMYLQ